MSNLFKIIIVLGLMLFISCSQDVTSPEKNPIEEEILESDTLQSSISYKKASYLINKNFKQMSKTVKERLDTYILVDSEFYYSLKISIEATGNNKDANYLIEYYDNVDRVGYRTSFKGYLILNSSYVLKDFLSEVKLTKFSQYDNSGMTKYPEYMYLNDIKFNVNKKHLK